MATVESATTSELEQYRRELTGYAIACSARPSRPRTRCRRPSCGRGAARAVRGPVRAQVLAVPDRHERLLGHVFWPGAACAADGSRPGPEPRSRTSPRLPEVTWIEPICPTPPDVAAIRARRSGSRSSPRSSTCRRGQRAVLILCEVLRWQASEVGGAPGDGVARSTARCSARARRSTGGRRRGLVASSMRPSVSCSPATSRRSRRTNRRADRADPRGRTAVDAAVLAVADRARRHLHVVVRPGNRLQGLPRRSRRSPRTGRPRSASTSLRPTATGTSRGRCRSRAARRLDRRADVLPGYGAVVPALRAARPHRVARRGRAAPRGRAARGRGAPPS